MESAETSKSSHVDSNISTSISEVNSPVMSHNLSGDHESYAHRDHSQVTLNIYVHYTLPCCNLLQYCAVECLLYDGLYFYVIRFFIAFLHTMLYISLYIIVNNTYRFDSSIIKDIITSLKYTEYYSIK